MPFFLLLSNFEWVLVNAIKTKKRGKIHRLRRNKAVFAHDDMIMKKTWKNWPPPPKKNLSTNEQEQQG